MKWCHPTLRQFAKAAVDSGTLYCMRGPGGYAAVEGSLPGFEAFLPLWTSPEAAQSQQCGEWERFVVRPQPVHEFRYFKDDFVMNRWAAACYVEESDEWVEASFLSLLSAILREEGRRSIKGKTQQRCTVTAGFSHLTEPDAPTLPRKLRDALDRFVARAKVKGCVGHASASHTLAALDASFLGLMPPWYRQVLERSAIADISFKAGTDFRLGWTPSGHFRDAETLLAEIEGGYPDNELARNGYLSIGAAGDGDCWVIRSTSTEDDPVFLCRMSAYGTNDPADSKGCLLQHSDNFISFLDEIEPTPIA